MIHITGPNWPSIRALRADLTNVPESGTFHCGGPRHDSLTQLTRFRFVGLRTPEFTQSRAEALGWLSQGHTVFARRRFHTQGRDIIIARPGRVPPAKWFHRTWWSKFVPTRSEWRIHIFDDTFIERGRKTWVNEGPEPDYPIRSRSRGYRLRHDPEPPDGVVDAATRAVSVLGYLYGAVDVLELPDDTSVVLEVNRLPAMDNRTRGAYVTAIRKFVGCKEGGDVSQES